MGRKDKEGRELVVAEPPPMAPVCRMDGPLSIDVVKEQVALIQRLLKEVLVEGEDFGKVPGCGDKPALFKAGAEKLCVLFRFAPMIDQEVVDLGNGHREYRTTTTLYNIQNGQRVGQGIGVCSTMESKYRWRQADRLCPVCGKPSIMKSKRDPGWYCWSKRGGCGANFPNDNDPQIVGQVVGRMENPDIADQYNTVAKMSKKRSLVDAALTATGSSHLLTQDIEDMAHEEPPPKTEAPPPAAKPATQPPAQAPKPAPAPQAQPPATPAPSTPPPASSATTGNGDPVAYVTKAAQDLEGGMNAVEAWCRKVLGKSWFAARKSAEDMKRVVTAIDAGDVAPWRSPSDSPATPPPAAPSGPVCKCGHHARPGDEYCDNCGDPIPDSKSAFRNGGAK